MNRKAFNFKAQRKRAKVLTTSSQVCHTEHVASESRSLILIENCPESLFPRGFSSSYFNDHNKLLLIYGIVYFVSLKTTKNIVINARNYVNYSIGIAPEVSSRFRYLIRSHLQATNVVWHETSLPLLMSFLYIEWFPSELRLKIVKCFLCYREKC